MRGDLRIVGVDPGKRGAIAFYMPALDVLRIWDVPTLTKTNAAGRKFLKVDVPALARIGSDIGLVDLAVHEKVGSRPGEAPSYAFDFGYTSGLLTGLLIDAAHIRHIAPAVWKARLGVTADKNQARARASEIFPTHAHRWPLVKHDGRAEAAMLAYYGAQHVHLD